MTEVRFGEKLSVYAANIFSYYAFGKCILTNIFFLYKLVLEYGFSPSMFSPEWLITVFTQKPPSSAQREQHCIKLTWKWIRLLRAYQS